MEKAIVNRLYPSVLVQRVGTACWYSVLVQRVGTACWYSQGLLIGRSPVRLVHRSSMEVRNSVGHDLRLRVGTILRVSWYDLITRLPGCVLEDRADVWAYLEKADKRETPARNMEEANCHLAFNKLS